MSELFKPLTGGPLLAPAAAAPAGAVGTATASPGALPPALAEITAGTVIAGVVVERSRGVVLLKTDKGVLQLQTNLPLKLGASVVLEVQSVGAQVRLAILSIDQHAPAAPREPITLGTASQASTPERDEVAGPAPASRASPQLIGRTVIATVVGPPDPRLAGTTTDPTIPVLLRRLIAVSAAVRAAAGAPTTPSAPSQASTPSPNPNATLPNAALPSTTAPRPAVVSPAPSTPPAATDEPPIEPLVIPTAEELEAALKTLPAPAREIVAALLDDSFSQSSKPGTAATPVPAEHDPASPSPPAATTSAPAQPQAREQAQEQEQAPAPKTIAIRILAQSPAGDPTVLSRPHIATPTDAITLVGTVVADESGATVIATPIGRLRLPVPASLPDGSRVTFEIVARPDERGAPQVARTADMVGRPTVDFDWPAVRELAARWPEAADALLPKAGQPLGPAVLAFIVAMRSGGNLKAWLGSRFAEAAESPERKDVVTRAGHELATQARTTATSEHDGWRTIAVPVIDVGRVSEIRFRLRKRERRDDDNAQAARRFVVETTLSALGPLRLDGTVREKHLDLVVRTARALPAPMRKDIAEVFARALESTSYRGEIRFHNDAPGEAMGVGAASGSGVVV